MKIEETMVNVFCEIENIIGWETYNSSYNDEEGCEYRYPVEYYQNNKAKQEGKLKKERGKVTFIEPECLETMRYKFGSNQLNIGIAIENVMNFLEKRYQLNFNQLELMYKKEHIDAMRKQIENGDGAVLEIGRYAVGIDIPEGKYILVSDGVGLVFVGEKSKGIASNGDDITFENQDIFWVLGRTILRKSR